MKKAFRFSGLEFEHTSGLSRQHEVRDGKEFTLCVAYPSRVRFEYPKGMKLPFVVVKNRKLHGGTLLFTEDGTAFFRADIPTKDELEVLKKDGCTIHFDLKLPTLSTR